MKFTTAVFPGLILAGLALPQAQAGSNDVWLATKAKVALLATEGLNVRDVDVAASLGVVTLHGSVKTDADKAKAGEVVTSLPGVKGVRNLMRVAPNDTGASARVDDNVLRRSVDAALRADPRLEGVKVVSVENGVVVLEGSAASEEEEMRATELAWAVPGVSRVTSRIEARK